MHRWFRRWREAASEERGDQWWRSECGLCTNDCGWVGSTDRSEGARSVLLLLFYFILFVFVFKKWSATLHNITGYVMWHSAPLCYRSGIQTFTTKHLISFVLKLNQYKLRQKLPDNRCLTLLPHIPWQKDYVIFSNFSFLEQTKRDLLRLIIVIPWKRDMKVFKLLEKIQVSHRIDKTLEKSL